MNPKSKLHVFYTEILASLIATIILIVISNFNIGFSSLRSSPVSNPENEAQITSFLNLRDSLKEVKKEQRNYAYQINGTSGKGAQDGKRNNLPEGTTKNSQSKYPVYVKQVKFTANEFIYLNEKDTTEWKKVPGIGSSFSARIVKYQNLLGGFRSIEQLKEVYGVTDEVFDKIVPYVRVNKNFTIVKLNINKSEFKEILAHPYINYEQTKAIVNLRKRTGDISSLSELTMLEEFSPSDIQKITPYIEFKILSSEIHPSKTTKP